MINKLMLWAAKMALGKHILSGLAWAHNKADGHRSEITLGLLGVIHGLKLINVIDKATSEQIETALSLVLPVVLADRAHKVMKTIDSVVPTLPALPAEAPVEAAPEKPAEPSNP